MTDVLIQATGLGKAFGYRPVLRGIDLAVTRGATVALLGPNGSGKTTLLRILAALSKPSAGMLTIGGWQLPQEAVQVRAQLGVVMHLPLLYDDLTAKENLAFFANLYAVPHASARISTILERVGLAKRSDDLVRTFSRGMQQRLALARAMLHDPAILLLDEPYTGLDVHGSQLLDELFMEWQRNGKTVIASLHELPRAAALANHTIVLHAGKIAFNGATPDSLELAALFQSLTQ